MNQQEKEIMEKLATAWNDFIKMEPVHSDEVRDFRFHMNALQTLVLARPAQREMNLEKKDHHDTERG